VLYPHEVEAGRTREPAAAAEEAFRVFTNPNADAPEVHLLSNSRYHVMITSAGGGYSLWNDVALTRWREDPTRDPWGTFIYLRDLDSGQVWSTAYQPTLQSAKNYEAIFSQGRAEFRLRLHETQAHTEISISPEDDIEVRRVTLANHSGHTRSIEVTSFAEVVLNTMAADQAHPAFSKLFVQTEILRHRHAILCSRRPRGRGDQPPWMFHLMLVRGEELGVTSFETDRTQFLGRGRNASSPVALEKREPLSGRHGSVLDPAIALRRTIRLGPDESARITIITGVAATRDQVMNLVQKYQDRPSSTAAWRVPCSIAKRHAAHRRASSRRIDAGNGISGASASLAICPSCCCVRQIWIALTSCANCCRRTPIGGLRDWPWIS
jgi:cellobiose phosphorylase